MTRRRLIYSFAVIINFSKLSFCQPQAVMDCRSSQALSQGVTVESVVKGSQADRLGIRPGDILLGWGRGAEKGTIDSPFLVTYIAVEQASRGLLTVRGLSGGQKRAWVFGSETWGLQTRPNFLGSCMRTYEEAMQLASEDKASEAAELLGALATVLKNTDIVWLAPWFQSRVARLLFHAHSWQLSDEAFGKASQMSEHAGPLVRAELFRQWASSFEYQGRLSEAATYYKESLLQSEEFAPETMQVANSLLLLAAVDLERDDMDQAELHLTRALGIARRLAPSSFQTASIFEDLGILFEDRGDLEKAEGYYLEALPIEERHFRKSRQLANTLTNLGTLAHQKGDLNGAEAYHRRALAIAEGIEENGPQLADILSNLGECLLELGNATRAEGYQKRALAQREHAVPGTLAVALNLASLGKIARIRHDFARAEQYYADAMTLAARVEAPAPERARLLTGEADLLRDRGDYQTSEEFYRRALAIIEKSNPGSIDQAEIIAELAGTLRHQGQLDSATELYPKALAALESRAIHLGGVEEDRSRYRAWYVRYYREYIDALLQQDLQERAFEVLEGSRARTLVEMLSQAHINLTQGGDSAILVRERTLQRALQAKTELRIKLITSEHSENQISKLDREIEDLLMQARDVKTQLRLKSPSYAALTEPTQLSAAEIQSLLDENTLLLEYSLGEHRSHVWAVTTKSLIAYELPSKTEIETAARDFYTLVIFGAGRQVNPSRLDQTNAEGNYDRAARRLSQLVLGPLSQLLGKKRLLIVADGALQYVPFSALPIPGSSASTPLVVKHEIVNLPSASVLAEIRRQNQDRPRASGLVAVFADPVFDTNDTRVGTTIPAHVASPPPGNDLTRSASDLGFTKNGRLYLSRLIYSREEADSVMAVVAPQRGLRAVDFDASRTTAMSGRLSNYRIVHFATHGLLNNKHPELSGLILSLVNREDMRQDGFLKLQDIYDLKLHADLVVLSGCDTGLGQEIDGEGLIGLTRGFMYAGASRVVASLWSVSDMATATLMGQFYKSMEKDGMRPAAALRAAQVYMRTQSQWQSPYYWAAFQMQGEWR